MEIRRERETLGLDSIPVWFEGAREEVRVHPPADGCRTLTRLLVDMITWGTDALLLWITCLTSPPPPQPPERRAGKYVKEFDVLYRRKPMSAQMVGAPHGVETKIT